MSFVVIFELNGERQGKVITTYVNSCDYQLIDVIGRIDGVVLCLAVYIDNSHFAEIVLSGSGLCMLMLTHGTLLDFVRAEMGTWYQPTRD